MKNMNMNFSSAQKNAMLSLAAKKLGRSQSEIASAVESGNINALASALGEEERKKLNSVLSDPEAIRRVVSDPNVQSLIASLSKGGRNNG